MLFAHLDVVTGSVVDREIIAKNEGSDMIHIYRRSMSDTAEEGVYAK